MYYYTPSDQSMDTATQQNVLSRLKCRISYMINNVIFWSYEITIDNHWCLLLLWHPMTLNTSLGHIEAVATLSRGYPATPAPTTNEWVITGYSWCWPVSVGMRKMVDDWASWRKPFLMIYNSILQWLSLFIAIEITRL